MADEEPNPIDQLVDLFVYAPIGLLYEYDDVLPKLVKRGKSQVQLARVFGQLAVNRGRSEAEGSVSEAAEQVATVLARGITEIGAMIGLAPPHPSGPQGNGAADPAGQDTGKPVDQGGGTGADPAPTPDADEERVLPIARYDELTAKEIIPLLDDLDDGQRGRIRAHEEANRARKTVLAKLDRLDG